MSQLVETATKTFTAGGALAQYLRVKLSSGELAASGIADEDIGVLEEEAFADGDIRAVRLESAQGTRKMVAAGAFNAGVVVYQAAAGKIDDVASGANRVGIALEAATDDDDVVEVLLKRYAGA